MGKKRVRKKLRRQKLMDQLRALEPEWTDFEPASLVQEDLERYTRSADESEKLETVWRNSRYQVLIFDVEAEGVPSGRMKQWAEDFAERRDRTITTVEGNFEWTRFHFEPEYDDVDEWETMMVEEGM
jgi:hypothetical protein